jgi:hypothetical protein
VPRMGGRDRTLLATPWPAAAGLTLVLDQR